MKAPYFSVVIDTYNYGRFIEEAVASVLAQDFPATEREILVVDDGSTDDTAIRLRKYGHLVRYLHKPNGGQASAFNLGFAEARGEVIALLDADDTWLPQKLPKVQETFERNPDTGLVYHRAHLWDGVNDISEDPYFIPVSGRVLEDRKALLRYPMVSTSCLAFRMAALQELLPVPEALRFQADAYLTALIIFVAGVEALPEFLGKYRQHGANLFQGNGPEFSRGQLERRMATRGALQGGIRDWLRKNGHNPNSSRIRPYLEQWNKSQEADRFALQAPRRWEYAVHLLGFPLTYGEIMTPRHRAYSYLRACAALFLGYHHIHVLDDLRMKRKRLLRSSSDERPPEKKERAMAAKAGGY